MEILIRVSYTKFLGIFVISCLLPTEKIDCAKLKRESSNSKSFLEITSLWHKYIVAILKQASESQITWPRLSYLKELLSK